MGTDPRSGAGRRVGDSRHADVLIGHAILQRNQVGKQMVRSADHIMTLVHVEGCPIAPLDTIGVTLHAPQIGTIDRYLPPVV